MTNPLTFVKKIFHGFNASFQTNMVPHFCIKKIDKESVSFHNCLNQDSLHLHDGSVWKIDQSDIEKMRLWNPNNKLVIVSTNESENHHYKIVNLDSKERPLSSINAKLVMGPRLDLQPLHVNDINHLSKVIKLNNGIKFQSSSGLKIKDWMPNDIIILGMKNSPDDPQYEPNDWILINIQSGKYVTAHHIF